MFISFHFFCIGSSFSFERAKGGRERIDPQGSYYSRRLGKIAGLEKFEETEEDKSIVESCRVLTSSSGGWLPPLRELYLPEIPPSPSGPRFRDKFREMEEMMHSKFA